MPADDVPPAQSTKARPAVTPFPGPREGFAPNPRAEPQPEPVTDPVAASGPPKMQSRKRLVIGALVVLVLAVLGGTYGRDYLVNGRFMVSTDDAYIRGNIVEVSARIQGYVSDVAVTENQRVAPGDVILRLDDGDYRIALEQAKARLATQTATLNRIDAQRAAAQVSVTEAEAKRVAAEATLRNARTTATRTRDLAGSQAVSQSQLDDVTASLDTASAYLAGAEAAVASAKANVAVIAAQYTEAQSQTRGLELSVEQAQRDLDLTTLRAPFAGTITNFTLEKGDLVTAGQKLAGIVPTDDLYIEANFKETQLFGIGPGAKVSFTVDAIPDRVFEGSVASVAPATGSQFSVIPPQNATGNFTKVVQRVPVRISLPQDALDAGLLRAGLSVVVDVDSRTVPAAK